jgi:hypothetical protein
MAVQHLDAVAYDLTHTGTTDIDFDNAVVIDGFFSLAEAGATNGSTLKYRIRQGNDIEIGSGTYTTATKVLTRNVTISKIGGTAGTSKIDLDGATAQISIVLPATEIVKRSLENLASVAINTSLVSDTDNTDDLGSATFFWRDAYVKRTLYLGTSGTTAIDFGSGDGTVTYNSGSSGSLTFAGLATYSFSGNVIPSGAVSLGTTANGWSGLCLDSQAGSFATLSIQGTSQDSTNRTLFLNSNGDWTISLQAHLVSLGAGTNYIYHPQGKTTIASGSFAANNDQVFSAAIPETYSYLVLTFDGLSSNTATRQPLFQVSTDAGATYDTTAGNYEYHNITGTTLAKPTLASLGSTVSVTAAQTFSGCIKISNYQGGMRPTFEGHVYANGVYYRVFGVYTGSTNNIDGLRMIWNSTGNSDAGTWSLDGIA